MVGLHVTNCYFGHALYMREGFRALFMNMASAEATRFGTVTLPYARYNSLAIFIFNLFP